MVVWAITMIGNSCHGDPATEFLSLNICLKIRLEMQAASGGRRWGGVLW